MNKFIISATSAITGAAVSWIIRDYFDKKLQKKKGIIDEKIEDNKILDHIDNIHDKTKRRNFIKTYLKLLKSGYSASTLSEIIQVVETIDALVEIDTLVEDIDDEVLDEYLDFLDEEGGKEDGISNSKTDTKNISEEQHDCYQEGNLEEELLEEKQPPIQSQEDVQIIETLVEKFGNKFKDKLSKMVFKLSNDETINKNVYDEYTADLMSICKYYEGEEGKSKLAEMLEYFFNEFPDEN